MKNCRFLRIGTVLILCFLLLCGVFLTPGKVQADSVVNYVILTQFGIPSKGIPAVEETSTIAQWPVRYSHGSVQWYEDNLPKASPFEFLGDKNYYAKISVKAASGYVFPADISTLSMDVYPVNAEASAVPVELVPSECTISEDRKTLTIRTATVYVQDTCTVSFEMHGLGIAPDVQIVNSGDFAKDPGDPKASGDDVVFEGWYTTEDYKEIDRFSFNQHAVTQNIILHAHWLKLLGDIAVTGLPEPVTGDPVSRAEDLSVPAGADYSVQSMTWYTGMTPIYHPGTFEAGKKYSAQIGLLAAPFYAFPKERTGLQSFTLNGKIQLLGLSYQSNYTDMTFWTTDIIPKCRISFDAGGGSGSMPEQLVEYNASWKLPANGFTAPEGKVFDKWDAGEAGTSIAIQDNQVIHALWKVAAPESPKSKPTTPAPTDPAPADPAPVEPTSPAAPDSDEVTPEHPKKSSTLIKEIEKVKTEADLPASTYYLLQARASKVTSTSVKLKWIKVPGAKKYVIYGTKCGKKNAYKKITELKSSKTTYTQKKLKKGTYYRYIVFAVKGKKAIAVSKTIHAATAGGKKGNPASVQLNKKTLTLKAGKSKTVKATVKKGKLNITTHRKVSFESSDPSVATVSAKGKIRAVSKGSCIIYAYAQNGLSASVKVKVK